VGGAEDIEAKTTHDDNAPPADILDFVDVSPEEAGEGILDHVLGVGDVAEHAEREVDKERPVLPPHVLELITVHIDAPAVPQECARRLSPENSFLKALSSRLFL
jgi:hypothetical protein